MKTSPGDFCERIFVASDETIETFGAASGDRNPIHFDESYAAQTRFGTRVAHGMLTASFISAIIGNELPGPGSIYVAQTLSFQAPVYPGDNVRCRVEVVASYPDRRRVTLSTRAWVGETLVLDGEARVIPPPPAPSGGND